MHPYNLYPVSVNFLILNIFKKLLYFFTFSNTACILILILCIDHNGTNVQKKPCEGWSERIQVYCILY